MVRELTEKALNFLKNVLNNVSTESRPCVIVKNARYDADTKATILVQNDIDYNPKVSVIIPVYNVEEYLRECLDSVINQTLREIEIICVDDGSTDDSLKILQEYAEKDNRITIMTQQNLHAGVARNAGLAVARGEYVHFVDSDDWVEADALEKLYNIAVKENIDVLKFKNKIYDNQTKQVSENAWISMSSFPDALCNKPIKIQDHIEVIKLPDSPWSGIYKLSFLNKEHIRFDNLICVNDTAFCIEAVSKGRVYATKEIALVVYRINNNKSLIGIRHRNFFCQLAVFDTINNRIKHLDKKTIMQINARTLVAIGYRINEYFSKDIDIDVKEQIFTQAKQFFESVNVSEIINQKTNFIYPIQHILPIYNAILDAKNFAEYNIKYTKNQFKPNLVAESRISTQPKVSVIIPVYNVERYLSECLDSIANQTLHDIEIICVDDGSTDKSLDILKSRANSDPRFTVIALKNSGAAVARNTGIAFANGEFVAFMDSDDFYPAHDTLEYIYKNAKQHNALICGGSMNYLKNGELINDPKQLDAGYTFECDGFINYSDYQYDFGFTRFIYNREFIYKHNIRFPEYLRFEDPIFFINAMALAKKFYAVKRPTYVYRVEYKEIQWTLPKACDVVRGITDGLNLSKKYGLQKLHCQYAGKKLHHNWLINNAFSLLPMNDQLLINMLNAVDMDLMHKIDPKYELPKYKNVSQVKISVIIPCYKVEKFLPECLDSVINQTLREIEIICVNDGSPDNSLKILQQYAARDNRIKIIDQKNQGLSCSRNNALKTVRGEYVLFLDSDDWIRQDTCELLYNKSKKYNLDMLNFAGTNYNDSTQQYTQLNGQKILYVPADKDYFNRQELETFLFYIPISACRFFYRMAFLNEHDVRFPEGINFEDNYFVRKALLFVQNYGVEREALYFRRVHGESITQNVSKFFNDYIEVLGRVEALYEANGVKSEIIKKTLEPYFNYLYEQLVSFAPNDRKKYAPQLFDFYHKMATKYGINNAKYGERSYYENPLKEWYHKITGDTIDFDNPQTFNQKIQWLKLYDSTPIKTRLADKYLVRDWVSEKIGDKYLIPLLGVYDKFDDIDFDKLPNQFVIKTNHGSGWLAVITDKSKMNIQDLKQKFDKWMSTNFAFVWGIELHYRDIKPKIIIEKFVSNDGKALWDYKFWCFNGKVKYMQFRDDFSSNLKMVFYDLEWHKQPFFYDHPLYDKELEKPSNFDEMVQIAQKLCQGFAFVCVDLYRLNNGEIKFGEMTFTRSSGTGRWNDNKYNKMLGDLIKLPKHAYNIDTGEYYNLPNIKTDNSTISVKPYLLFPYYMLANTWMENVQLPVLRFKKHMKSVLYSHSHRGKMDMLNANFDKVLQSIQSVKNDVQQQIDTVRTQQNNLANQINTNANNTKNQVNTAITDIQNKLASEVDNLSNKISQTSNQTQDNLNKIVADLHNMADELNYKITGTSDNVSESINQIYSNLANQIDSVAGATKSRIDTAVMEHKNITDNLDTQIALLNTKIKEQKQLFCDKINATNMKLADIKGKLVSGISDLSNKITESTNNSQTNLNHIVEKLNSTANKLNIKMDGVSDGFNRSINHTYQKLANQMNANMVNTQHQIDAMIAESKNQTNDLGAQIDDLNDKIQYQTQSVNKKFSDTDAKFLELNNQMMSNIDILTNQFIEELNSMANGFAANVNELSGQITKNTNQTQDNLNNIVDTLNTKITDVSDNVNERINGISDNFDKSMNDMHNALSEQIQTVSTTNTDAINSTYTQLSEKIGDVANNTASLAVALDGLSEKNREASGKINNLTEKTIDIVDRVNALSDKSRDMSANINNLSDKSRDISANINNLSDKTRDVYAKMNNLSDKNRDIMDKVDDLSDKTKGMSDKINNLHDKINELSDKTRDITTQTHGLSERIDDVVNRNAHTIQEQCQNLAQNISDMKQQQTQGIINIVQETTDAIQSLTKQHTDNIVNNLADMEKNNRALFQIHSEPYWANVYHDTINNSHWLQNKSVSPGRWAVSYIVLYVLYRVLDEIKPQSILECGLGQSSKLTIQYADTHNAQLMICENNPEWLAFFQRQFPTADKYTKILNTEMIHVVPEHESRTYAGFKNVINDKKFNFVLIDGPLGSAHYSRPEILDIIDNLDKSFVIMLDDMNRIGEQEIWALLKQKLTERGIAFRDTVYKSDKHVGLLCSMDLAYLTTL